MTRLKFILTISIMMMLLALSGSLALADAPSNINWYVQYYNNRFLEGAPVTTGHEVGINHEWNALAPATGVSVDDFSVRWTGSRSFDAGVYEFSVKVDDGVRVWVDSALVIDQWKEQSATTYSQQVYLSGGVHHLQVAYFEAQGLATIQLDIQLVTPDTTSPVSWTAEYFTNPSLAGSPAKTQTEAVIDYDWGINAPTGGIPADNFSVRWTTNTQFLGGTYDFSATVDDGVRVWVDGDLLIDQWREQSATTFTAQKTLSAGSHRVQMAYFEAGGDAVAKLQWHLSAPGGGTPTPPSPTPSGDAVTVDNLDPGFLWGGVWRYRHTAYGGQQHSYFWTKNATFYPENYGKWTPTFGHGGNYEVWVFIPPVPNATHYLRYRVLHDGSRADKIIDQAYYGGNWVSLGTYHFNGDNIGKEFVLAYDNTHEPYASRTIAFDAVKFVSN